MNRPLSLLICIMLPIVVLLLGIIFSGFYAFQTVPQAFKDDVRAVVPPKFTTRMADPQRYSLWVYSNVNFGDKNYATGDQLPAGAKIHVIDKVSGDFLPLNNWMTGNKNLMEESAFLVGTFETGMPGQEVEIIASGLTDERVIGISSKSVGDIFRAFITIFGIFVISLFLAITILIVLLHRRSQQIAAAAS